MNLNIWTLKQLKKVGETELVGMQNSHMSFTNTICIRNKNNKYYLSIYKPNNPQEWFVRYRQLQRWDRWFRNRLYCYAETTWKRTRPWFLSTSSNRSASASTAFPPTATPAIAALWLPTISRAWSYTRS